MTCKLSDKCDNVFACNILRPNVELLGCNFYKPKKPMTNEEWFCTLPTEEKAKTIVCLEVNALHKWKKGLVKSDVDEIKRWLKEKHE